MTAKKMISKYTGGVMAGFVKSAIFQRFWDHFHIVKLVQHKCQNQLVNSNIKDLKPRYLMFLGVTYIHPCLKQLIYQKKMQVTHSNAHLKVLYGNAKIMSLYWLLTIGYKSLAYMLYSSLSVTTLMHVDMDATHFHKYKGQQSRYLLSFLSDALV